MQPMTITMFNDVSSSSEMMFTQIKGNLTHSFHKFCMLTWLMFMTHFVKTKYLNHVFNNFPSRAAASSESSNCFLKNSKWRSISQKSTKKTLFLMRNPPWIIVDRFTQMRSLIKLQLSTASFWRKNKISAIQRKYFDCI